MYSQSFAININRHNKKYFFCSKTCGETKKILKIKNYVIKQ